MPGSVPGVGDITARRSAHMAPVPKVTVLIKKHPNKKLSGSRPCTAAARGPWRQGLGCSGGQGNRFPGEVALEAKSEGSLGTH